MGGIALASSLYHSNCEPLDAFGKWYCYYCVFNFHAQLCGIVSVESVVRDFTDLWEITLAFDFDSLVV
jgi:hypothetical protein